MARKAGVSRRPWRLRAERSFANSRWPASWRADPSRLYPFYKTGGGAGNLRWHSAELVETVAPRDPQGLRRRPRPPGRHQGPGELLPGCGARADRLYPPVYGYESLLHAAVSRGYPDLVKRLLACGLDANLRDSLGKPPLYYIEEQPTVHRRTGRQVAQALLDAPEVLRRHRMNDTAAWLSSSQHPR